MPVTIRSQKNHKQTHEDIFHYFFFYLFYTCFVKVNAVCEKYCTYV